ncbi:MAG: hypothetical protein E7289_03555 [Lachnospiraceae bacterium]|nr:hypothetical protein [Lachnospiraceae bacterium]
MNDQMPIDTNAIKSSMLYKIFVTVSIMICLFLFPSINTKISEHKNQIALLVWSVSVIYITLLIILIVRKTNHKGVYYPLSLFTLIALTFNLGAIYLPGSAIIWYLLALSYPLIGLMVVLGLIGHHLDHNSLTKKKLGTILGSFLAIMALILLMNTVTNFIHSLNQNKLYNDAQLSPDEYTKTKNEIMEQLNNLLDNNLFCVYEIELNEDCSKIIDIELLVISENVPDNEIDFCNKIIDSYTSIQGLLNTYEYTSDIIHFEFTNKNPFAKADSTFYQESGYIREEVTSYYIYLNPSPIEFRKK